MHAESIQYMRDAFQAHAKPLGAGRVLDVGAWGKRAFFREVWESGGWQYHGCDMAEGPNVDTVLADPWIFPFEDDSFDAVISGQMLEHNSYFWLSFLEMTRVMRPGGVMIHIAPSRGVEHRAPQDCWRFYRDGMQALADWTGLTLLDATTDWAPEHFDYYRERRPDRLPRLRRTMKTKNTVWGDTIGVFRKERSLADSPAARYLRHFAAVVDRLPALAEPPPARAIVPEDLPSTAEPEVARLADAAARRAARAASRAVPSPRAAKRA